MKLHDKIVEVYRLLVHNDFIELDEMTAPGPPDANKLRLYVKDVSGATVLVIVDAAGKETALGVVPLSAPSTGDLVMNTGFQDVPGATVTLPFAGTWVVIGSFDMTVTVLGGGTALGQLDVDGVAQSSNVLLVMNPVNNRASVANSWVVTAVAGSVAKLRARVTAAAGTSTVLTGHTRITAFLA